MSAAIDHMTYEEAERLAQQTDFEFVTQSYARYVSQHGAVSPYVTFQGHERRQGQDRHKRVCR